MTGRAKRPMLAFALMAVVGSAHGHVVPLVVPASDTLGQSFVRVVNDSPVGGVVVISAYDDAGERFGPVTLSIGAHRTVHFNSGDLESGNPAKGLPQGVGAGAGDWRLEMRTSLDIRVLAYMRSHDGFLTAMHDLATRDGNRHFVPIFNPASNRDQKSSLRIVNMDGRVAEVTIDGVDDAGQSPSDAVGLSIPAGAARTYTAIELETGTAGLRGALGDGIGKWRLTVRSEQSIGVMSLLESATGHLTNLSTAPEDDPLHEILLFSPASHPNRQGFVRIRNRSPVDGTVSIHGIDEDGVRYPPLNLNLGASTTTHFNASDFETGNPDKGLPDGVGPGRGAWRLRFQSDLDIQVLAYVRTRDGFLTSMHDTVMLAKNNQLIPTFNPASNQRQVSLLRLVNPGPETVEVVIEGVDDNGSPSGVVRASVPADGVRTYTSAELEAGEGGLSGGLGDGAGKWRLTVASDQAFRAMSLMESPTAHLSNLSTFPPQGEPTPPARVRGVVAGAREGASPVGSARCELLSLAGVVLASATADDRGQYVLEAPSGLQGYLRCTPPGQSRAALEAYLAAQPDGGEIASYPVSPATTVLAMLLKAEDRDPRLDLAARASELSAASEDDAHLALLIDVAERSFAVLREHRVDAPFATLLFDIFANGRADGPALAAAADALGAAIDAAEDAAGTNLAAAASRAFSGVAALSEPAPLPADAANLASLAEDFRTAEFARNPSLAEMNAHWAYARGMTGLGEVIGMTDTGIYAAHHEFTDRLHGETLYTVIGDDIDGDGAPEHSYVRPTEKPPEEAYPADVQSDDDPACQGDSCKFYDYGHGSLMASLSAGARNAADAHGIAFDARLLFRPFRQRVTPFVGRNGYHVPDGRTRHETTKHDLVRQVGALAPIVSNSWLTVGERFSIDPAHKGAIWPFHEVLPQGYADYQRDHDPTQRAMLLWAAGNRPIPGGPGTGDASVPSLTERQVRAASGGERGLADLLLTDMQRQGLSAPEALDRAERIIAALKAQWLTVTALAAHPDTDEERERLVACVANPLSGRCLPDYTMGAAARCGFASDWCVATGSIWGGVLFPDPSQPPTQGAYVLDAYRSSEATAAAAGALAVTLQAYRDTEGALTVPTSEVLKRLKATANADVFDYDARHAVDGRNLQRMEEELVRSLIRYAGATDEELRNLVANAKDDLMGLLPDISDDRLSSQETHPLLRDPFTDAERSLIESAKEALSEGQWARFRLLNRLVVMSGYWDEIDTFPPQLKRVRALLRESETNDERANGLLALLIRQVEWIDEQLLRLGKTRGTVTDRDIRRITVTSMIGHGLVDLKAATDPAR